MTSDKDLLKNIGTLFEKRRNLFNRSRDKSTQINTSLKAFLKDKFGDSLKGYSIFVDYNSRENSLIITADSKIIANELTLQLVELSDFLKRDNIRLDRILVR